MGSSPVPEVDVPSWFDRVAAGAILLLPAGRRLITQNHPTSRFIMVIEGELMLSADGTDVEQLLPGSVCGEIGLLDRLDGGPGIARGDVVTHTDATVRSLAPWEFKALVESDADIRADLDAIAAKRPETPLS